MREKLLFQSARLHARHPWRMLALVIVLTIIFIILSTQLQVTMRWSDLLPESDPRTVQFNKIIDEFTSSTSIIVVVQGEENQIKQFADELAPRLLTAQDTIKNRMVLPEIAEKKAQIEKYKEEDPENKNIPKLQDEIAQLESLLNRKLIKRVDYKAETDFLKHHGLLLMKEDDLKNMKDIFMNPNLTGLLYNINNSMEKEYVGQSESISTREKEDGAVIFLDGLENLVATLQKYMDGEDVPDEQARYVADKLLFGEPYFLSYDEKALILNAIPNFTMMDTELMVNGTDVVQAILNDVLKDYPDVTAGLTGFIPIGHDEMVYSEQSLGYTSVIAVIAILVLLIVSLRMWVAPILGMFNLIIGIIWAIGLTALLVGQLNIMTQMMAVILLGLGIDFSIHLISGFTEFRGKGDSIEAAMEKTFASSGKGVITGGLTTAFAFLTMMISQSRGMKEMGLVTGAGLLAIMVATFLLLPVLLVFRERVLEWWRAKKGKSAKDFQRDLSFEFMGEVGAWLSRKYIFTLLVALILTAGLLYYASNITFDQNYMNIEPEGLTSIVLQDTVMDKFDMSMDYALILADSIEQSRRLTKQIRDMGSVAMAEDISLYLPSAGEQAERVPHIQEIISKMQSAPLQAAIQTQELERLKTEIDRLQMNVMEMQTLAYTGGQDKVDAKCAEIVGNPEADNPKNIIRNLLESMETQGLAAAQKLTPFQKSFAPYFKSAVLNMSSTNPISMKDLPVSILDRYSNKTRDQFLVTVFPSGHVWKDAEFLARFVNDLERATPKATGMPPVFRALIEVIGQDGRKAVMLTIVIVFLLLWFDFRNVRHALMAMIPLAVGLFWMVGLMHLTGQQLTVMNVMGLPMILGIGIDDGVHIVHRWVHEGRGKLKIVFASTGKAILLTSLTTMLGFGSLVFSIWRGFGQLGGALFVGVAACFLTTVLILPGIIGLIERKTAKSQQNHKVGIEG